MLYYIKGLFKQLHSGREEAYNNNGREFEAIYHGFCAVEDATSQPHANTSNVFMDRNLGAYANDFTGLTSYGQTGLMYQWGRKYPFPGSVDFYTPAFVPRYDAMGNSIDPITFEELPPGISTQIVGAYSDFIKNLTLFYTNMRSPSASWGTGAGKTVYDPCPAGWRVPENRAWNGLTTGNFLWSGPPYSTRSHTAIGTFPASGVLSYSARTLSWPGEYGRYWPVTPHLTTYYAYSLEFSSSLLKVVGTTNFMVYGCAVRCVQE